VGNDNDPGTGLYSFKLWNVPPASHFAIAIGDTVSNSVPGPGAGNIESPGVKDIYTFNATAGQQIYPDLLAHDNDTTYVDWRLVDSTGSELFDTCLGCSAPAVQTLTLGGVYTLTVGTDRNPGVGTYSFKLWNVPPPDHFAIAIGDTISDGAPGPGAGNIESPGVKDIYTFNAAPGQQIDPELLAYEVTATYVDWRLVDSAGSELFDTCLGCSDPSVQTLTLGGVYTLTFAADRNPAVGTYSFQLQTP
jgi:hypothetical protein